MKEKIDGHVYDTETARKYVWWDEGEDDENWKTACAIYRTRTGFWFKHVEYDGPRHGEELIPLPQAEAMEQIGRHMNWLEGKDRIIAAKAIASSYAGSARSEAKATASRENGKKGGRPGKPKEQQHEAQKDAQE